MFTILVLNRQTTVYSNFYQERDWLFKIRIANLQKYGGPAKDVCGRDSDMNF
jgi:hypothetical protein